MRNFIIDIEFTGLDNTYIKDNEIIQLKFFDVENEKSYVFNYSSEKQSGAGAFLVHGIINNKELPKFSFREYNTAITTILINPVEEYTFWGYSVSQDKQMLIKYGITAEIKDMREILQLSPLEERLSKEGSSAECAYYMITGKIFNADHGSADELTLLYEIYKFCKTAIKREFLFYVPHGHCAGMPISEYILEYRRAADGYRFNNNDIFAASLSYAIECYEYEQMDESNDAYDDED